MSLLFTSSDFTSEMKGNPAEYCTEQSRNWWGILKQLLDLKAEEFVAFMLHALTQLYVFYDVSRQSYRKIKTIKIFKGASALSDQVLSCDITNFGWFINAQYKILNTAFDLRWSLVIHAAWYHMIEQSTCTLCIYRLLQFWWRVDNLFFAQDFTDTACHASSVTGSPFAWPIDMFFVPYAQFAVWSGQNLKM